jgi:hypothetical protein
MKKLEIFNKISALNLNASDVKVLLRLVTILAATHLAHKVDKILKEIDRFENPDSIIRYLK